MSYFVTGATGFIGRYLIREGVNVPEEPPTQAALAFANLLKGMHW